MHWMTAVERLRRERQPGVLVTVMAVRGHAPREAGAKMVVGAAAVWGTDRRRQPRGDRGRRARELIASEAREPETRHGRLTDKAPAQYGVQCCGGEVTLLLEPLPVGAVRGDLRDRARRHSSWRASWPGTTSSCTWSTRAPGSSTPDRLRRSPTTPWPGCTCTTRSLPELVLGELPAGSHVLIMTHDHAEDAALCDAALRCGHLASIGLIGSSAKWRAVREEAGRRGPRPDQLARITTPIGLPGDHREGPGDDRRRASRRTWLLRVPRARPAAGTIEQSRRCRDHLPSDRPRHPGVAVHRRPPARRGRLRHRRSRPGCRRPRAVRPGARPHPGRRGGRPDRRRGAARAGRHPRPLPAGPGDRRARHAAARLA